jgi:hypothetical protein
LTSSVAWGIVEGMTTAGTISSASNRVERPKTKQGVFADIKEFMRVTKLHGGLVPMSAVGTILGVSRQRVHQLADEGTFTVFEFYGMKWLLEEEVVSFGKLKRAAGENQYEPSKKQMWKEAQEFGKEFIKGRQARRGD